MAIAPGTGTQENGNPHIIREHWRQRAVRRWARLFPWQECILCGGYSRSALLCGFCRRDLPRAPTWADPSAHVPPFANPRRALGLDLLRVAYTYRFPVDVLIWHYKYRGELALAPVLAGLLPAPTQVPPPPAGASRLASTPLQLVAVPSGRQRLRERGFDAAGRLVAAYARRTGLAWVQAQRVRDVPPQAGLSLQARRDNLHGVFALPTTPALQGRRVLIVDDVLTSGGTLRALAAACRLAGAAWVGAVVLAVTPSPEDLPRW